MDLVGKTFRSPIRILYVERTLGKRDYIDTILGRHEKDILYKSICLDKGLYGYSVSYYTEYEEPLIKHLSALHYSVCPNTNIISKVKYMLKMNYLACRTIANSITPVEYSDYRIKIQSTSIILWGHHTIMIYEHNIYLEPVDESEQFKFVEAITEEDYNRIFDKVKQLKEDIDKLWT